MTNNIEVIFDNGGGITVQTAGFVHCYDDPQQAAHDVRELLNGENPEDWDGNEPECRLEYEYETERNGGYKWFTASELKAALAAETVELAGHAQNDFFRAMGKTIQD